MKKDRTIKTSIHKIALLENVIHGDKKISLIKRSIELLRETGINEISLSGAVRYKSTSYLSLPGILNYLDEDEARKILPYALKNKIKVSTRELVDEETIARNIWTGLNSAKLMGLELGKYGIFPLTLEEILKVTEKVQRWFNNWTAAPVLYIDYPIVTRKTVFDTKSNLVEGIKLWIKVVSKNNIPVILIDTADKSKGFKLVKKDKKDKKGLLNFNQIRDINEFANNLNVKTLWAGGISLDQVFEFGKMRVFGIYVTSSAATQIPVSERYKDENMPVEKEPTFEGVYNSKLMLEVGFLTSIAESKKRFNIAKKIKYQKKLSLESLKKYSKNSLTNKSVSVNDLHNLLFQEWKHYLSI